MRGKLFVKFLRAIKLIERPQGASISELMDELGIDRTSVYRLFRTIEDWASRCTRIRLRSRERNDGSS